MEERFQKWARASLLPLATSAPWDDLAPLSRMVGDATVVALSEATHGSAEPLEFRNRVFQYLVREKGFTAIAIESGLVESRAVHDYVRGAPDDLTRVLAQGISWTFDQLPQNRALIQWMREYNHDRPHLRKVSFYGFDVSGSPSNARVNRGIDTALIEALGFVRRVDAHAAAALHARVEPVIGRLRFGLRRSDENPGYERLTQAERDTLTATIADLISLLERSESRYTELSSAEDYAWACRAAVGARQVDAWLRHVPIGWQPVREPSVLRSEQIDFLPFARDTRDRAQADNLDWILAREAPLGKVLVFASRYHLSAAPVKASFWSVDGRDRVQEVAGIHLRRRLGDRLVTIGNLIGEGEAGCGSFRMTLPRASPQSMDGLCGELGVPFFLLDLRAAPAPVRQWLSGEHCLADGSQVLKLSVGKGYDILLYIDAVTPAGTRAS
jgi:erythromycin esterase